MLYDAVDHSHVWSAASYVYFESPRWVVGTSSRRCDTHQPRSVYGGAVGVDLEWDRDRGRDLAVLLREARVQRRRTRQGPAEQEREKPAQRPRGHDRRTEPSLAGQSTRRAFSRRSPVISTHAKRIA